MVSIITAIVGNSWTIWRVRAIPSIIGIWISMSTTSGRWRRILYKASKPSTASPAIRISSSSSSSRRSPSRIRAWSSTSTTLMTVVRCRCIVLSAPKVSVSAWVSIWVVSRATAIALLCLLSNLSPLWFSRIYDSFCHCQSSRSKSSPSSLAWQLGMLW